jgi:hypothetical protein
MNKLASSHFQMLIVFRKWFVNAWPVWTVVTCSDHHQLGTRVHGHDGLTEQNKYFVLNRVEYSRSTQHYACLLGRMRSRVTGVNKRPRAQPARPRPEETDRARRVLNTAGWPWRFRRHGQGTKVKPAPLPGTAWLRALIAIRLLRSVLNLCEDAKLATHMRPRRRG